eukprot:GHUV01051062.1.p1 GENE.GHUV01051062.1~~GHUV01051062.1.p1  ORF type:complete len:132 (+),score=18.67 GHUV01051062.1:199-594(+)
MTAFCDSFTSTVSASLLVALRNAFNSSATSTANAMRLRWRLCSLRVLCANSTSCTQTHQYMGESQEAAVGECSLCFCSTLTGANVTDTLAPSASSGVCTKEISLGDSSRLHDLPNFSRVGKNAAASRYCHN